jgi:hypothetical protein
MLQYLREFRNTYQKFTGMLKNEVWMSWQRLMYLVMLYHGKTFSSGQLYSSVDNVLWIKSSSDETIHPFVFYVLHTQCSVRCRKYILSYKCSTDKFTNKHTLNAIISDALLLLQGCWIPIVVAICYMQRTTWCQQRFHFQTDRWNSFRLYTVKIYHSYSRPILLSTRIQCRRTK